MLHQVNGPVPAKREELKKHYTKFRAIPVQLHRDLYKQSIDTKSHPLLEDNLHTILHPLATIC